MNRPENYPLQTYLQSVVVQTSLTEVSTGSLAEMRDRMLISDRTFKSAQIFLGALPILCVYCLLYTSWTGCGLKRWELRCTHLFRRTL